MPAQLRLDKTANAGLEIFLWSRAAIWAGALFAFLVFEPNRHPRADRWDVPALTRDLGFVVDVWARWDSVFYLRIAEHGYDAAHASSAAFYPLYPAAVGILGRAFAGHYVLAGVAVSLAACLGSFLLLYRLAEERIGADAARRATLYAALFPTALFFQAVYSESLFLLLALGAFVLAERGRFLSAGGVTGLAMLTRPVGVALLPALAILAWRSRQRGLSLAKLGAGSLAFAVYPLVLWQQMGDPWAFLRAQDVWNRRLSYAGPLGGIWDGLRAAVAGVRQLASGSHTESTWPVLDTDPMRAAALNLATFAFLVLFLALAVVVWRRFGAPYGVFSALSLAIPLSFPTERWPLLSLPRFGLVVFPFFLVLAVLARRPRVHTTVVAVSSLLLGISVAQWALWQWVA